MGSNPVHEQNRMSRKHLNSMHATLAASLINASITYIKSQYKTLQLGKL